MADPVLIVAPDTCASGVTMNLVHKVGNSESPFTFEEQSFKWPGERWIIEFNLPPQIGRDKASEWIAFGLKMQGSFNVFLMGDPSASAPRGIASGAPVVNGAGQTGNTLSVRGWTPSVTNILRKGDYIQVGTGLQSRLHMVLDDANSDIAGIAVLNIAPALKYRPNDGTLITVNSPKGVFKMAENTWSWSVLPGRQYRLGFTAVEVVNA